jgi:hypothetical protein
MSFGKSNTANKFWPHGAGLGALALAFPALHAEPLRAQTDACALLKVQDVAPLLGGAPTPTATPEGQGCTWVGARPDHKLAVLTYKNRGVPGEAAYSGARHSAQSLEGSKVADESGIGDQAFSGQVSFGAIFVVLKQGRLLQLQYWSGGQGTSEDVAALRPLVKEAVAAF